MRNRWILILAGMMAMGGMQPAACAQASGGQTQATEPGVKIGGKKAETAGGIPSAPGVMRPAKGSEEAKLWDMLEGKIIAEWEAIKRQDKKTYGDLLADDYQGVEVDGRGERNKIQILNEVMTASNVANYTLWGFKVMPVGADGALVIYEVTLQFPPRSVVRMSRVYISELWQKRGGEWKEVHYQETHVK